MILFEANAVATLVKLPDAAVEERVQLEMGGLMTATARRKAPPLQKTQGWAAQIQRRLSEWVIRDLSAGGGNNTAQMAKRVYNAGNLLQGPNYY